MQLDGYEILSEIGEGEIAVVYHAYDTVFEREVALKVLRDDSPLENARAYLEEEANILAQIYHPAIPKLYDYLSNDITAIVFEYIDGEASDDLLARMNNSFLPEETLIDWARQLCDALDYLHNHEPPIAYCDLKASHCLIDKNGLVRLVDFNLARELPPNKILYGAEKIGTVGYAAPHQYQGILSPLVDIYALGATLHYLATGIDPRHERPFTFAPPRSVNSFLSRGFASAIMRAVAYEPDDRFQSAAAMKAALGRL